MFCAALAVTTVAYSQAKNLEDEVQPQVKDVVAAVRRVLYLD